MYPTQLVPASTANSPDVRSQLAQHTHRDSGSRRSSSKRASHISQKVLESSSKEPSRLPQKITPVVLHDHSHSTRGSRTRPSKPLNERSDIDLPLQASDSSSIDRQPGSKSDAGRSSSKSKSHILKREQLASRTEQSALRFIAPPFVPQLRLKPAETDVSGATRRKIRQIEEEESNILRKSISRIEVPAARLDREVYKSPLPSARSNLQIKENTSTLGRTLSPPPSARRKDNSRTSKRTSGVAAIDKDTIIQNLAEVIPSRRASRKNFENLIKQNSKSGSKISPSRILKEDRQKLPDPSSTQLKQTGVRKFFKYLPWSKDSKKQTDKGKLPAQPEVTENQNATNIEGLRRLLATTPQDAQSKTFFQELTKLNNSNLLKVIIPDVFDLIEKQINPESFYKYFLEKSAEESQVDNAFRIETPGISFFTYLIKNDFEKELGAQPFSGLAKRLFAENKIDYTHKATKQIDLSRLFLARMGELFKTALKTEAIPNRCESFVHIAKAYRLEPSPESMLFHVLFLRIINPELVDASTIPQKKKGSNITKNNAPLVMLASNLKKFLQEATLADPHLKTLMKILLPHSVRLDNVAKKLSKLTLSKMDKRPGT